MRLSSLLCCVSNESALSDELDMPKPAPVCLPRTCQNVLTSTLTQAMAEYTRQQAQALFKRFADDDDPEVMGPAGVEKLCTEAGIPLEGAQPLILAWQFSAQEMAKFSRSEWLQGTETLRCVRSLVYFGRVSSSRTQEFRRCQSWQRR